MIPTTGLSICSMLKRASSPILKKSVVFLICGSSLGFASLARADELYSFGLEYGIADDQVNVIQVDLVRNISVWFDERVFNAGSRGIGTGLELSALHWSHELNSLSGVSIGLRFDYGFDSLATQRFTPFFEYSLGMGLISETVIAMRDMSTAFHFKNQLGLGVRTNRSDFLVRISHFSNASIAAPNDGINILTAGFIVSF